MELDSPPPPLALLLFLTPSPCFKHASAIIRALENCQHNTNSWCVCEVRSEGCAWIPVQVEDAQPAPDLKMYPRLMVMIGETEILTAHPARLQGGAEHVFLPDPGPAILPPPLHPVPLPPSSQDVLLAPLPHSRTSSQREASYPSVSVFPRNSSDATAKCRISGAKGISQMGGVAQ